MGKRYPEIVFEYKEWGKGTVVGQWERTGRAEVCLVKRVKELGCVGPYSELSGKAC